MKRLLLLFFLLTALSITKGTTEIWVDSDAPADGNGNPKNPYNSISSIPWPLSNDTKIYFMAASTVYSFNSQITISNRSLISLIGITPIGSNEEIVFDGTLATGYVSTAFQFDNNSSSILVDGIIFQNFGDDVLRISGASNAIINDITIQNCKFRNIRGLSQDPTESNAAVRGRYVDDLQILNNQIIMDMNASGQTDGIMINDQSSDIIIKGNYIKCKNETSVSHIDCIQIVGSSNVLITDNTLIQEGKAPGTEEDRTGMFINQITGYLKIFNNNIVSKRKNLINVHMYDYTDSVLIINNTLHCKEDRDDVLYIKRESGTINSLSIKNNIFSKIGVGDIIIKFSNVDHSTMTTDILNYNDYFITEVEKPKIKFEGYTDMVWYVWEDRNISEDPVFNVVGDKYKISLHSPCKNNGQYFQEVSTDLEVNRRPYWENGVDIGAFEIDEAQIRIGWEGPHPSSPVEHNITSIGKYWSKDAGTFSLSTDQDLLLSTYITYSATGIDKEAWDGFRFKWLRNSAEQPPMGHAFYKITNSHNPNAYFYLDLRDAVISYSPNIYIKYNASSGKYLYSQGDSWITININGTILRIWDIKNGNPNTASLSEYWKNALVIGENTYHKPLLCWGLKPSFSTSSYKVYRALSNQPANPLALNYSLYASTGASTYSIIDPDITIDPNPDKYSFYFVRAYNGSSYSDSTNIASTSGDYLPQKRGHQSVLNLNMFTYSLAQNYPNPFNPKTRISFSIAEAEVVAVRIYDCIGKEVKTLVKGFLEPGNYVCDFNAEAYASGIYFCRMTAGEYTGTIKMQLLK